MKKILPLLFFAPVLVQAQIHYCIENGKKILTDKPCGVQLRSKPSPEAVYQERVDAYEARQRFLAEQEREQLIEEARSEARYSRSTSQNPPKNNSDSYACQVAIRNAGVQLSGAARSKIAADRAKAEAVCGYDPFASEKEAEADKRLTRRIQAESDIRAENRIRGRIEAEAEQKARIKARQQAW